MRRVPFIALLLFAASRGLSAQTILQGSVIADDTERPIARVRVSLTAPALGAPVVLTDGDGQFSLPVPAATYRVIAIKTGFARRELTPPASGQRLEIRLTRGASVSGRVVDEYGEPVIGARVAARVRDRAKNTSSVVATTDTDDRGEYRLSGIPPAAALVSVTTTGATPTREMRGSQVMVMPGFQTTFYPNASTMDEGAELSLQAGQERARIDFTVPRSQSGNQPFSAIRGMPNGPLVGSFPEPAVRAAGAIRGRVVGTDGQRLSYAQVMLTPLAAVVASRVVSADADGQFVFGDLPAGRFRLGASKPGYLPTAANRPMPLNSGQTVDLADAETRDAVDLQLARWGTVAGYVLDEDGEPLQGARVELLQVRYENGRRRLVSADATPRLTDDLGAYRLYGVAPGWYVVSASIAEVGSATLPGYARTYYPGTSLPNQARLVTIGSSTTDAVGIDIGLERTRTFRVAGRLLNAAGEATSGGSLQLTPSAHSASVVAVSIGARILPDGGFEFPNVTPGTYVVQSYRGRVNGSTEGEFGVMAVSVSDRDVTNLVLQTSVGSTIAGWLSLDAADPTNASALQRIEITPVPVDPDLSPHDSLATADIQADGRFAIAGIHGPRRLRVRRLPPGWALKAILVNGIDITDRPLPFDTPAQSLASVEVVLTDRVSQLVGTLADDRGRPASAQVIVFSTDRDRWYAGSRFVARTPSGADGAFGVNGLPFGTYYAAAIAELPSDGQDAWQDAGFLESLVPRATTVTVAEGQQRSVALQLAPR